MPRYVKPGSKSRKRPPKVVNPPTTAYQLNKSPEGRRVLEARLLAARSFTATVEDGRANFADMLSRLWRQASDTLENLEQDRDMALKDRLSAMQKIAKIMPMLAKAEKAHVAEIGGVAVEDMSSAQLEAAVSQITNKQ